MCDCFFKKKKLKDRPRLWPWPKNHPLALVNFKIPLLGLGQKSPPTLASVDHCLRLYSYSLIYLLTHSLSHSLTHSPIRYLTH